MTPTTFRKKLLDWYNKHKRPLPFRKTKNPYNIWLSEVMAQQTTMAAVIPYYNRFTKKYKDIASVANAKEQDLLHLWQGLGYYSRIRNFQKACQDILDIHNGEFPKDLTEIKKLKGVGDYTAAAISSICFEEPVAVVDGNVKRVLSRVFKFDGEPTAKSTLEFYNLQADKLLSRKNPGDYNQAVMELGALICTPKSPKCLLCPVRSQCQVFHDGGNPEEYPVKKKQTFKDVTYTSLILHSKKHILLTEPKPDNLIKNMWEIPSVYKGSKQLEELFSTLDLKDNLLENHQKMGLVKHAITNKKITNLIYTIEAKDSELTKIQRNGFTRVALKDIDTIPINTLSRKILNSFLKKHVL